MIYTTGRVGGAIPEQALIVRTVEGQTLITGCAHPGVVKMTQAAMDATGRPVTLVLGGFHLADATQSQVRSIVDDLRELGVERAGPAHCSGDGARALFRDAFGEGTIELGVGQVLVAGQ